MTIFLWTMIALFGLTAVGKLIKLADGSSSSRVADALDVFVNACFIIWAVLLLQ